VQSCAEAIQRVDELPMHAAAAKPNNQPAPVLSLDGISKVFPGVKALSEVKLDLFPGEVTALVGENGAMASQPFIRKPFCSMNCPSLRTSFWDMRRAAHSG